MAAPKGNQFWKIRSKHGRDKILSSPEILWKAACEYFEWCDSNPFQEETIQVLKVNGVGDEIKRVNVPKMRPYTWQGLEIYLDISDLKEYKRGETYKDFFPIIDRIGKIIYNQKFSGAASGFFKENIIARELGIADKQDLSGEIKQTVKIKADLSKLSAEELRALKDLKEKLS